MNFLAHLYLSADNPQLLIGNFIADAIPGNRFSHLPKEIQQGIFLHRQIDTFTDAHPVVRKSKRRLHERYGHYDGVIIDIFYDYFLAKHWQQYSQIPLQLYSQRVYELLQANFQILPEKTQQLLPYMIQQDWLYNYQYLEGVQRVLIGVNKRTQGRSKMDIAINDLITLEKEFYTDFRQFFKDLRIFSVAKINTLNLLAKSTYT